MWTLIEYPPEPFGECGICKRHTCGEYQEDGATRQKWFHTPIEMDKGGNLVIGYQCVHSMSEEAGISKSVVEKEVYLTPTAEQIHAYIMQGIATFPSGIPHIRSVDVVEPIDSIRDRLKEKGVRFHPNTGEAKLRELAMQHV